MKQKTKPALRVVAGNPHIRRRQPRRPPDMLAMILPPINLFQKKNLDSHAFECEAMGLTNWQVNRAWQLVNPSYARFDEYVQATNRVFLLWQALEKAFEQERREVLAVLQEHHPAVVRKIMKSLKPKS